jgi:hypothetical protein
LTKLRKCPKFTWKLKQTIVMVGLPRNPIKNEGCGEEVHSMGRIYEEEMKKGSHR